jgi:hypothetical protein
MREASDTVGAALADRCYGQAEISRKKKSGNFVMKKICLEKSASAVKLQRQVEKACVHSPCTSENRVVLS